MQNDDLKAAIEAAYAEPALCQQALYREAVETAVAALDAGRLRVAEPVADAAHTWQVNEWAKKAVLLYFRIRQMQTMEVPPMEFYDKIPLKKHFEAQGVRVVPHGVARYGAYLAPGVVMMPSYVNIGAYVDGGTLVDTWATVGSCAQIGKRVHLSGGVGIGGVLEPVMAKPVIVEDDCFIGSRAIIVEGVHVEAEAVIGANVCLTQSTKIIDVSGAEPVEYRGRVPARSVVIPGTVTKRFPAGDYGVACALIIGRRKESTDKKTTLNDVLRDFQVAV
ncbi:MAG: 2,3,4,5-tetrahydropyridine-2,6-dicarboxylate N-succinyltransferase [Bacteroidales bacterium]|nr:2,3,4,5-tetrahydropyridine-2,6-dicarboxylate N-succinyltransferase [Bacteroidales bacterium]MDE5605927.1 2,3,4,5-tetrahydropyridine-2,6-dicarboxylate N-succinyltransferase [Bacteroidales bacterium]